MRALIFVSLLVIPLASNATLEPELGPEDKVTEGGFCPLCKNLPPRNPAHLEKLQVEYKCGPNCEKLMAAAKAEGTRCPHIWADFQILKHRLPKHSKADACEFYRKQGLDPTQWSKGQCATAIFNDFKNAGHPIEARKEAFQWADMLRKNPRFHMREIQITDPDKAPRGTLLIYNDNRKYGHAEWAMGDEFCSDYCYPGSFLQKAPREKGRVIGAFVLAEDAG